MKVYVFYFLKLDVAIPIIYALNKLNKQGWLLWRGLKLKCKKVNMGASKYARK
jgi:hypothetical protein